MSHEHGINMNLVVDSDPDITNQERADKTGKWKQMLFFLVFRFNQFHNVVSSIAVHICFYFSSLVSQS